MLDRLGIKIKKIANNPDILRLFDRKLYFLIFNMCLMQQFHKIFSEWMNKSTLKQARTAAGFLNFKASSGFIVKLTCSIRVLRKSSNF